MKIKRFVASTMREAIRLVRDEQGPDAVILSNRRVDAGVEVVAAVDYDEALMRQATKPAVAEAPAVTPSVAVAPDVACQAVRAEQEAARAESAQPQIVVDDAG